MHGWVGIGVGLRWVKGSDFVEAARKARTRSAPALTRAAMGSTAHEGVANPWA